MRKLFSFSNLLMAVAVLLVLAIASDASACGRRGQARREARHGGGCSTAQCQPTGGFQGRMTAGGCSTGCSTGCSGVQSQPTFLPSGTLSFPSGCPGGKCPVQGNLSR